MGRSGQWAVRELPITAEEFRKESYLRIDEDVKADVEF